MLHIFYSAALRIVRSPNAHSCQDDNSSFLMDPRFTLILTHSRHILDENCVYGAGAHKCIVFAYNINTHDMTTYKVHFILYVFLSYDEERTTVHFWHIHINIALQCRVIVIMSKRMFVVVVVVGGDINISIFETSVKFRISDQKRNDDGWWWCSRAKNHGKKMSLN